MQRRPVCPSVPPLRRSHKRALSESPPRSSRHSPGPNFTGGGEPARQSHLPPESTHQAILEDGFSKSARGLQGCILRSLPGAGALMSVARKQFLFRGKAAPMGNIGKGTNVKRACRRAVPTETKRRKQLRWASSRRIRAGPNAGALGRQKVKPFTPVARRSRRRGVKRMKEEQRLCRHTCSSSHCLSFPKDRRGTTDGRQTTKRHCCDTRAIFYRFASLGRPTSLPR